MKLSKPICKPAKENSPTQKEPSQDFHLELLWDQENHASQYSLHWLYENCYSPAGNARRRAETNPILWTKQSLLASFPQVSFQDYLSSDKALFQSLQNLADYGITFINKIPKSDPNHPQITKIVERIGPVRETFYGKCWDVISKPQAENIAYTSLQLSLHQDLLYFESPPGLQFLHCLEFQVKNGGETEFVDGFHIARQLQIENPAAFQILTKYPQNFHYLQENQHRSFQHPLISIDQDGNINNIFYAPPFEGPLRIKGSALNDFYSAYQAFAEIAERQEYKLSLQLKPGDCVIFHNRRLLHGRKQFDATQGLRHLHGAYSELDDFQSRWRVLRKKYSNSILYKA
eukprot:Sdes_comp20615_c0_seq1m15656